MLRYRGICLKDKLGLQKEPDDVHNNFLIILKRVDTRSRHNIIGWKT
jgi:hypothetical protein